MQQRNVTDAFKDLPWGNCLAGLPEERRRATVREEDVVMGWGPPGEVKEPYC